MAMQWKYSNGYDTSEFLTNLAFEEDAELTEEQKDLFLACSAGASSLTLTLGLGDGQPMFIVGNSDCYAFTAANLEGDTGETIKSGEVWLAIGATASNATSFTKLYGESAPA